MFFNLLTHTRMQIPTHNNLHNMNQPSSSSEFLRKLARLALSFSLFSFLFFHPSWFSFLVRVLGSYLGTVPSRFLSLASDKNCIFLLCNGILVVIARFSSRTGNKQRPVPFEIDHDGDMFFKGYQESLNGSTERLEEAKMVLETNEVVSEEPVGGLDNFLMIRDDTEREVEERIIYVDDHQNEDEYDTINTDTEPVNGIYEQEEEEEEEVKEQEQEQRSEEEEEEEEIAKMSTEELNRKFEDFIRKMREDLRIEARQQLIMV